MKKIALMAMSLVLAACVLTACRNNSTGDTGKGTNSTTGSQQTTGTKPTTTTPSSRPTEGTSKPTESMPNTTDGTNGGSVTDGDGVIGNGTQSTTSGRNMRSRF